MCDQERLGLKELVVFEPADACNACGRNRMQRGFYLSPGKFIIRYKDHILSGSDRRRDRNFSGNGSLGVDLPFDLTS